MILSVSRRTDIPAFYSDWFFNRVKEGYVCVRNPMNIHQISMIPINADVVDCIVFWSKNPKAMLARLDEIEKYNYYFQFTLNPYDKELEVKVPKKHEVIETFKKLSDKIGNNRVIWRYDPILMTDKIDINYHIEYFETLAKRLSNYTNRCAISFIDNYKKTERNLRETEVRELEDSEVNTLSEQIAKIAKSYNIVVQSCAEKYDLVNFGIKHGRCIDDYIIQDITGFRIDSKKDKNQRKECGCIESIDIGEYNTCIHNCLYCYANFNKEMVVKKEENHNPNSPLLIGNIKDDDIVRERCVVSLKQKGLFDL